MEVTLTTPGSNPQPVYSQNDVNNKRLRIDIGNGRGLSIEFFQAEEAHPVEMAVCIENDDGSYQDIAIIRPKQDDTGIELLAYADSESEEYTHRFDIPFFKESEDENNEM